MSIQFSGTLTEQQFLQFQQHSLPTVLRWFFKWFPWILLGYILVKVFGDPGYITSSMFVFDLFLFFFFLFLPKLRESQTKQAWESNKVIQGEISGVVDQEGISWNHTYGETRYPWEVILKYRETADLFILYIGVNQALLLPRSFFQSEEDWKQLGQLVAEKLPKKPKKMK